MRGSEHREHLARFEVKSMCRRQGRWSSVIFRGERERPCAPRTSARLLLQRPSHTKPTKTTDPALLPLTSTNYNTLRSEGKGWTRRRVGARRLVWSSLPPLPRRFPPPSPLFSPPVPTLFPPCPHPVQKTGMPGFPLFGGVKLLARTCTLHIVWNYVNQAVFQKKLRRVATQQVLYILNAFPLALPI